MEKSARQRLVETVKRAVEARGYAFGTGAPEKMNGSVREYPAAWLVPPRAKRSKGRAEGEVTYRMELYLAALPAGAAGVDGGGEAVWPELEGDAMRVVSDIAADGAVCGMGEVSYTPAKGSLTMHGEVSIAVEGDVTMWFYL